MAGPTTIGPLYAYRGDEYKAEIPFEDDAGNPIDVSVSTFVATTSIGDDPTDQTYTIDTSDAASGKIYLTLTKEQTTSFPQEIIADLSETPTWGKTLLRWTHIFNDRAQTGVEV